MNVERLRELAISDTGFVFDPYSGFTFSVNETGRFMLQALKAGHAAEAVAAQLAEAFDLTPSDDPSRDVHEFILMLREQQLLPHDDDREG
ncbi:MAG: PqqD family peptide modification chaperone [Myxococcaceae bacterium]|nr:PqqD family peptide modification chaperone [Myxococcaceae bacterium]